MASLKYWVWLATLRGVKNQMKLALLEHFEQPDKIYFSDRGEYALVEGLGREAVAALEDKSTEEADRILGDCERLGLRLLTFRDGEYPDRLRNIYNPPILLYVQGRLPVFDEEAAIAIVGSRRASPYALAAGEQLAYQLTRMGAVIVSGLAAGGDASAHRGALRAGGVTVGVIGNGHDVVYPLENRRLYEDLAVRGAIISEYPPGTEPSKFHFPERNRLISGLCLATVVTEAPARSGTLITASLALEQGRDLFAIPGHMNDARCLGSNRLLRDGAGLVTEPWDILSGYAYRFPGKIIPPSGSAKARQDGPGVEARRFGVSPEEGDKAPPAKGRASKKAETPEKKMKPPRRPVLDLRGRHGLTEDQLAVVRQLAGGTAQVDEIISGTELPAQRVLSALTLLEINGIVVQSSGKNFTLAVTLQQ